MTEPTELARAIRVVRGTATQRAFAKALGVRRGTVIDWETGRHIPGPTTAHHLIERGLCLETWLTATLAAGQRRAAS